MEWKTRRTAPSNRFACVRIGVRATRASFRRSVIRVNVNANTIKKI
jgi:hypothetical protein